MLRNLAFRGVSSELFDEGKTEGSRSMLRPLVWRIMLGVLSLDTGEWDTQLQQHRDMYALWKQELIKPVSTIETLYEKDGKSNFVTEY
jgi:hypothetical protein